MTTGTVEPAGKPRARQVLGTRLPDHARRPANDLTFSTFATRHFSRSSREVCPSVRHFDDANGFTRAFRVEEFQKLLDKLATQQLFVFDVVVSDVNDRSIPGIAEPTPHATLRRVFTAA